MWLLEIKGITKDDFHDVCFMSAECKHSYKNTKHLKAQYFLKKDAISDVKDLLVKYPNIVYELTNLGRTTSPIWFY